MAFQPVISKKKQGFEGIILFLIIFLTIFFLCKNFFKKEVIYEIEERGVISAPKVELYPPFSLKVQDILEISKFINLKIFSRSIEESGPTGNPNPFLPFK